MRGAAAAAAGGGEGVREGLLEGGTGRRGRGPAMSAMVCFGFGGGSGEWCVVRCCVVICLCQCWLNTKPAYSLI